MLLGPCGCCGERAVGSKGGRRGRLQGGDGRVLLQYGPRFRDTVQRGPAREPSPALLALMLLVRLQLHQVVDRRTRGLRLIQIIGEQFVFAGKLQPPSF
jgi:hypothetical protein